MITNTDPLTPDLLREAVENVVKGDLCTGCGACALVSSRVTMRLDDRGFLRPEVGVQPTGHARSDGALALQEFNRVCVGREVAAPPADGARIDPILGRHLGIWSGHAVDPEVRHAGSGGGVITALTTWLISTGEASYAHGALKQPTRGTTSVAVRLTTREEALAAAGSRYAPVGAVSGYDPGASDSVFVAKPCEVAAARQIDDLRGVEDKGPLKIGFFCAGTPSQVATDALITSHGLAVADVDSLSYRGGGWPGDFQARNADGSKEVRLSYAESWGKHLGPAVQPRCKVCPDGTGEWADIAVGDYWATNARGYPQFDPDDASGTSAVIARSRRGLEVLRRAVAEGVLELHEATAEDVVSRQPLQETRRTTLSGRLLGLALARNPYPATKRFPLKRLALRHPLLTARYARGMWKRARLNKRLRRR